MKCMKGEEAYRILQNAICLFENAPRVGENFETCLIECSDEQANDITRMLKRARYYYDIEVTEDDNGAKC